jgi:hypothetical protein
MGGLWGSVRVGATLAVASVMIAALPAVAQACPQPWTSQPVSDTIKNVNGIDALSPDDAWAVGILRGVPQQVATLHWDGTAWTTIPGANPNAGDDNVLSAVAAVAADNVWAVGYTSHTVRAQAVQRDVHRTLIEHWDGTSWTAVPSPNVGKGSNVLVSIAAAGPDDVWAVGYTAKTKKRTTLVIHWNGASWSVVPSPSPGSKSNGLLGVAAAAGGEVWAVGYRSSGRGYHPLRLHRLAGTWTVVGASGDARGERVLTSVSLDASGAWAAGYATVGAEYRSLVQRWDGSRWSQTPTPSTGDGYTMLRAVSGGASAAWAAGTAWDEAEEAYMPVILEWDGTAWSTSEPAPVQFKGELLAAAIDDGISWVGGRPGIIQSTACGVAAAEPGPRSAGSQPARAAAASSGVEDLAVQAGIAETTLTWGVLTADLTGDGLDDIFLGRHQQTARLYRNNGDGTFTEIHAGEFPRHDRHRCVAAQFDGGGGLDLFCAVGSSAGTQTRIHELWLQQPDGSFANRTAAAGLADPYGRGRSAVAFDADGDGATDLYVVSEGDRPDGMPSPNRLFLNTGGGQFVSDPGAGADLETRGRCAAAGDVDADGDQDLVLCDAPGLRLLRNDGGVFHDATSSMPVGGTTMALTIADVTGDGHADLVRATPDSLQICPGPLAATSTCLVDAVPGVVAVAVGDANGDGLTDLYGVVGAAGSAANGDDILELGSPTGAFSRVTLDTTNDGAADAAAPVDIDGDGRDEFVVTNGFDVVPGPVSLIRLLGDGTG